MLFTRKAQAHHNTSNCTGLYAIKEGRAAGSPKLPARVARGTTDGRAGYPGHPDAAGSQKQSTTTYNNVQCVGILETKYNNDGFDLPLPCQLNVLSTMNMNFGQDWGQYWPPTGNPQNSKPQGHETQTRPYWMGMPYNSWQGNHGPAEHLHRPLNPDIQASAVYSAQTQRTVTADR
ncbi:hypothetical protein Bbelb_283960 [Branchiostoma belcheri]|nr:hypothetical protein Bbelb_283960 [Branchiostoma belcheri]